MRGWWRGWLLVGVLLAAGVSTSVGQALATTTVEDTVVRADGTPAGGSAVIAWGSFTTATGAEVAAGTTTTTLSAGGVLEVALAPNAGAMPMGSYYTVVYHLNDGTLTKEFWVVPVTVGGGGPVRLASVRNQVLPTSVAMQAVSKGYVDAAIARAQLAPLDSSAYVLKTGDTMTGPLVLPGDPASAQQAADKNYVDENVAGVQSGLNRKVDKLPSATQLVAQPVGTELDTTRENGTVHAGALYDPVAGVTLGTVLAGADCTNGCKVLVDPEYAGTETVDPTAVTASSRVVDERNGAQLTTTFNTAGRDSEQIANSYANRVSTDAAAFATANFRKPIAGVTMALDAEALAGGNNQYPQDVESIPYFKSTYAALSLTAAYNTEGQHITSSSSTHCYAVGDCLDDTHILYTMGDFHDPADEGTHPGDQFIAEEPIVFTGTCATGCAAGSTNVGITVANGDGTQGEGRFLLDMNPAKDVLGASLVSADRNSFSFGEVTLSGASLGTSTFLKTASAALSQPTNMSPGTVVLPIATSGVPAGYATNTAALPASSGVACVADPIAVSSLAFFETANYTVVDGTHVQLTLHNVHHSGATIAVGGACGLGIEQTVDTHGGIRQVFPVVGTLMGNEVLYADSSDSILGSIGYTSGYANYSQAIATAVRSGGVTTATLAGGFGVDLQGLTLTVSGVSDPSFNGSFVATMTSSNTFTYVNSGADASSAGGTAGYATPGVALYPMAEVQGVFDAATHKIDGVLTLAPNTVNWASGDAVEMPHYFSVNTHPDTEQVIQTMPRPIGGYDTPGKIYSGNVGPGLTGWSITNGNPNVTYLGAGGTYFPPNAAYVASGVWTNDMTLTAGTNAVMAVDCNLHGCNRYDSGYSLFSLQSALGRDTEAYNPATSTVTMSMGAANYTFSPTSFTASTINVGTLHATTITGLSGGSITTGVVPAAVLPAFGPSGTTHGAGVVPDPGATAGSTRYLREDGTWTVPAGAPATNPAGGANNYAPIASPVFTGGVTASSYSRSGLPSGCAQLPCVVANPTPLTGQTGSFGSTALYTPSAAGLYRLAVNPETSTAGTGGATNVVCHANYTNPDGQNYQPSVSAPVNLLVKGNDSAGGFGFNQMTAFSVGAGQPIQYYCNVSGSATGFAYRVSASLMYLGQ